MVYWKFIVENAEKRGKSIKILCNFQMLICQTRSKILGRFQSLELSSGHVLFSGTIYNCCWEASVFQDNNIGSSFRQVPKSYGVDSKWRMSPCWRPWQRTSCSDLHDGDVPDTKDLHDGVARVNVDRFDHLSLSFRNILLTREMKRFKQISKPRQLSCPGLRDVSEARDLHNGDTRVLVGAQDHYTIDMTGKVGLKLFLAGDQSRKVGSYGLLDTYCVYVNACVCGCQC